jgi:hypothetical protein
MTADESDALKPAQASGRGAICRAVYGPFRGAVLGPAFTPGRKGSVFCMHCQARSRASCSSDKQDARERA